ncbi:kinase-like domain-containing protein [Rhizophagus irregularis DAOM 181602=DAOM 197198]|nr:kinase-like domain-containing protein [Rhizophagus irregularis DAOM 181602=DAOM 197198]
MKLLKKIFKKKPSNTGLIGIYIRFMLLFLLLIPLPNQKRLMIDKDFLNEIKSYLQIYFRDIVLCHGITQDPNTKDYMMVLYYCENGDLRNYYLNKSDDNLKLFDLSRIANGLLEPVNSSDLSSFQVISDDVPSVSANLISECFDCKI